MAVHLSVRLPWHDNGWNGCICEHPKRNTYCGGLYSVNAEKIRQNKDDDWEEKNAGKPVSLLDRLPPCAQHVNAFGDQSFTYQHEPRDFLKAAAPYPEEFGPTCFGTWAYDSMYDPQAGRRLAEDAERLVKELFGQLEKDKSLIFFYLNYSNPVLPEINKYVMVGVSRFRDKGDLMRWRGMPQDRIEKYGDLVWSRLIHHAYPSECFIIPYQEYLRRGHDLSSITLTIEGEMARRFKYVSRPLSDGDAAQIISEMLRVAQQLKKDRLVSADWDTRIEWLGKLLDDCWRQRGLFPGLAGVLGYLGFGNATDYARNVLNDIADPHRHVFDRLEGKVSPEVEWQASFQRAQQRWRNRPAPVQELLKERLCLFELTAVQVEHVLGDNHTAFGITSSPEDIMDNPYNIVEEYDSGEPDDSIALHQIDQGMMPSTKLPAPWRIKPDDPRRVRAALGEILVEAGESGHSFLPLNEALLSLVNRGEEWRDLKIDINDIRANEAHYSKRLSIEEDSGLIRIALKRIREHELVISDTIKKLLSRKRRTASGLNWDNIVRGALKKDVKPDEDAIHEQAALLEPAFCNSFFVMTGAAGTGKTTMLKAFIRGVKQKEPDSNFLLLAPTGKAALRLKDKTETDASTIDYILWKNGWANFQTGALLTEGGNLIASYKNVIIDESSMVDINKLGVLFRAIPWNNVRRLILVGDPNQLPPIGIGKPFADIIEYIDESPEYADNMGQLRVNCRVHQSKQGSAMLCLASGYTRFGEDLGSEEILSSLNKNQSVGDLFLSYWKDEGDLPLVLEQIIKDSLSQYDKSVNNQELYQSFNSVLGLADDISKISTMQILGPVRGEYFGVDNINFSLQKMLHRPFLQDWRSHLSNFARFDKVIHIINQRIPANWHQARKIGTKDYIESYVPNGALGAINVFFNTILNRVSSRIEFDMVPGVEFFLGKNALDERLELGYAITVHKSQGSDFDTVILVIPSRDRRALSFMSPELLYTALTRAQRRLYLLVQQTCQPFIDAAFRGNSVLLRINSALFTPKLALSEVDEYRPENLIHKTMRRELVRSKSELNIADKLYAHSIPYYYEKPLIAPDNTLVRPDFTIPWQGEDFYWEHLGMLDLPDYRARWERKKEWYAKHGFASRVITSDEMGGFDSPKIEEIIKKHFI